MQANTDQHLIEQTLQGDSRAYGTLVDRYKDYVFTIVLRMVKVREEAEEVAQDTFIKAYESLASFRGESKFSSWLYSIAYRKALDCLRKQKRTRTSELLEDITEGDGSMVENALVQMERQERSLAIRRGIMELPEIEAGLVSMYYYDEMSVKEISAVTELSEENIKVKLFRSRKKLFNLLGHLVLHETTNSHRKSI